MINANELRLGNSVLFNGVIKESIDFYDLQLIHDGVDAYEPVPLTPEILEKCGFEKIPHLILSSSYRYSLGRNRYLSINDCGTPNEMWFLTEEEGNDLKHIVTIRNYDYDKGSYLHQLQNLIFELIGKELSITL